MTTAPTSELTCSRPQNCDRCILLCTDANYERPSLALAKQLCDAKPDIAADICLVSEHDIVLPPSLQHLPIRLCKISVNTGDLEFTANHHLNFSAYLRLFAVSSFADSYQRILYLDSDMFFAGGDLPKVFDMALLPGHAVGAVRDLPQQVRLSTRPQDAIALDAPYFPYFNSGFLLIDTQEWIAQDIMARTIETIRQHAKVFTYNDQSALNITLRGNWSELSWKWNWFCDEDRMLQMALIKPVFLHFAGPDKPWFSGQTRYPQRFTEWYRDFLMTHYGEPLQQSPRPRKQEKKVGRIRSWNRRRIRASNKLGENIKAWSRLWPYRRRVRRPYQAIDPWP